MMTDQKKPEPAQRRSPDRRGWRHRLRHWWLETSVNAAWWRAKDWAYRFWHPRTPGGQRRVLLPVYLWLYFTIPLRRLLAKAPWNSPNLNGQQAQAPGRPKAGQGPGAFRRLRLWWQDSLFVRAAFRMREIWEWIWFSPSGRGQYGPVRQSRLGAAGKRFSRALQGSWPVQQMTRVRYALYDWWHPAQGSGIAARRKSRWEILLTGIKASVGESTLGRSVRGSSYYLHEWWYPPLREQDLMGTRYTYRRVSRPVMYFRRWRAWFRRSWLGREFGWLLDTILGGFVNAGRRLAQDLRSTQIGRFIGKRAAIAFGVTGVALIVTGVIWGFPQYNRYMERQYGMQARLFMEQGDTKRASLRARQAITLNPNNANAVTVLAELADKAGYRDALHWRARSAALTPTVTNRLALASSALRIEEFPYPTAAKTLRELSKEATNSYELEMLAASLAVKLGDLKEAEQRYQRALKISPEDPSAKISLASLHLQSADPERANLGRGALNSLINDNEAGALPLRALVAEAMARNDLATAETLSRQLLTNAQAKISDGIIHATILRSRQSAEFKPFLDDLQIRAEKNPLAVGELASWMNQNGMAGNARTWLEAVVEKAPRQTLLRVALADTYVALKDWEGLEKKLEEDRWPGLEHLRFAMLSLAVKSQGGDSRSRLLWDRSLSLASQSPGMINTLVRVTASWGWHAQTEQALWHANQRFREAQWPLDSLRRLYTARKDTSGLRRVFQEIVKKNPNNADARNNLASVSLLLLRDTGEALRIAKQLHEANPTNAIFASTYAFGLHVHGNTAQGLAVLNTLPPAQREDPSVAAYEGILLAAVGNVDAAAPLLSKADKAFLLPEETALVNSAKAKLAAR